MDVKRVPATSHSTISPSAEAGDRDRGKQNLSQRNRKGNPATAPAPTPKAEADTAAEEASAPSQMLDSEKVVILLAQRPQEIVKKTTTFRRLTQAIQSKKPPFTDEKKLNKSA